MMEKVPMTAGGYAALEVELKKRQSEDRPRIIEHIAEARSHGDLSENAEYHAAKEEQSHNEGRIAELEDKLARADIIDISKLSGDTIMFGATVTLVDEDTEKKAVWQIVGEPEADAKKGRISITSPLARALIGKKKGATVEVVAPGGAKAYEITKVEWRLSTAFLGGHCPPVRTGPAFIGMEAEPHAARSQSRCLPRARTDDRHRRMQRRSCRRTRDPAAHRRPRASRMTFRSRPVRRIAADGPTTASTARAAPGTSPRCAPTSALPVSPKRSAASARNEDERLALFGDKLMHSAAAESPRSHRSDRRGKHSTPRIIPMLLRKTSSDSCPCAFPPSRDTLPIGSRSNLGDYHDRSTRGVDAARIEPVAHHHRPADHPAWHGQDHRLSGVPPTPACSRSRWSAAPASSN